MQQAKKMTAVFIRLFIYLHIASFQKKKQNNFIAKGNVQVNDLRKY